MLQVLLDRCLRFLNWETQACHGMSVQGIEVQMECRMGYLRECLLNSHLPYLAASHFQEWCDGKQRVEGDMRAI